MGSEVKPLAGLVALNDIFFAFIIAMLIVGVLRAWRDRHDDSQ